MSRKVRVFERTLQLAWLSAAILTIAIAFIDRVALAEPNNVVFEEGFENGNFSQWKPNWLCCAHTATIVNSPVRSGNMAARFENRKEDNQKHGGLRIPNNEPAGSERWYGISFFVPEENLADPAGEILIQWHESPDRKLGEDWRKPPLVLWVKNDRVYLTTRWASQPVNQEPQGEKDWDLGLIQKGYWEDFVFHVKWSYRSDGLLEVWRNGVKLVQQAGPTYYNDERGPFVWIGMYKNEGTFPFSGSTSTKRVVYIDEFRIGDEKATYNDVVPRGILYR